MLETLISSKTRVKLLLKFFLNSKSTSYLRGLESEFGDSSNSIRLELNRFEKAGLLKTHIKGNKKIFTANTDHPLFSEIHNILLKHVGFDKIIENVINRLGDIQKVYVVGDLADGKDSEIIDLIFFGDIDKNYLLKLIEKAEELIKRKVRYIIYKDLDKLKDLSMITNKEPLLLWEK